MMTDRKLNFMYVGKEIKEELNCCVRKKQELRRMRDGLRKV